MRDLFIVIPGIMGSVLARDGDDLWKPGLGMATKLLRHRSWARSLTLVDDDDPADTGWVDGVVPTAVVESHTIVPGVVSIDGYSQLDAALRRTFGRQLHEGSPLEPVRRADGKDPERAGYPNYYRFAYDWRRDIRASALRLHDLIETALTNLRRQRSPEAKVVILGHSMGGLVARCYLYGVNPRTGDPFDGWRNVREVFTMGTPYRGSPNALQHLHDGFRKLFVDFSAALRSYTGVYQLLPRYPMVEKPRPGAVAPDTGRTRADYLYPHELDIDGLDPARARAAYENFHLAIDAGVERAGSHTAGIVVPDIGFGHATLNSAVLIDGAVTLRHSLPDYVDPSLAGGDGTVPLVSAIPLELDHNRSALRYTNQQHGSLQVDRRTLGAEIENRLKQSQASTTDAREGPGRGVDASTMAAIGIDAPQYSLPGQAPTATTSVSGVDGDPPVRVQIVDLSTGQPVGGSVDRSAGEPFPLPVVPGDYALEASCRPARLRSRALFSVLGDDAPANP